MLQKIISALAVATLATLFTPPVSSQWSRATQNGVVGCERVSGEFFASGYSKSTTTSICTGLNRFELWFGTAAAQSLRTSTASPFAATAAPPSSTAPPGGSPPVGGQWQKIIIGDATTAGTLTETSVTEITCGGDGTSDTPPSDGTVCYLPLRSGDQRIAWRLATSPFGGTPSTWSTIWGGFWDGTTAITGSSDHYVIGTPYTGDSNHIYIDSVINGSFFDPGFTPFWAANEYFRVTVCPSLNGQGVNNLLFERSTDGVTWITAGTDRQASLPSSFYPVIWMQSQVLSTAATGHVDHITIDTPTCSTPPPPPPPAGADWPHTAIVVLNNNAFDTGAGVLNDTTTINLVGRYKQSVFGGNNENWGSDHDRDTLISAIDTQAATHSITHDFGQYIDGHAENPTDAVGFPIYGTYWRTKVNNANCWGYESGTGGLIGVDFWSNTRIAINYTQNCTSFAGGDDAPEAFAETVEDLFWNRGDGVGYVGSASTKIDTWFHDNYNAVTNIDYDFDRDGTLDDDHDSDFAQSFRRGLDDFTARILALTGKRTCGNVPWFPAAVGVNYNNIAPWPPIGVNCGLKEHVAGSSLSDNLWRSGYTVMQIEKEWRDSFGSDPDVWGDVQMDQIAWDGQPVTAKEYRRIRGACGRLAIEGIGCMISPTGFYHWLTHDSADRTWFDEFQGGTKNDYNWMGDPVDGVVNPDSPQVGTANTTSAGYYRRWTKGGKYVYVFYNPWDQVGGWDDTDFDGTPVGDPNGSGAGGNVCFTVAVNLNYLTRSYNNTNDTVNTGASVTAGNPICVPEGDARWMYQP